MARFYFDVHDDGVVSRDDVGVELPDFEQARQEAQRILPAIAHDEIARNDDRKHYVVLVSDSDGQPIYSATLSYAGVWLYR